MSTRRVAISLLVAVLVVGAVAAVILALTIGVWIGGKHGDLVPEPLRGALVGSNDQIVVNEALDEIDDTYYRELPPGQLADTAIAGAVKKLNDRFSTYFTPAQYKKFEEAQASSFTGIGVTVDRSKRGLLIRSVYKGSPAKEAGIEVGDQIVEANGRSLKGLTTEQSSQLVKGPAGTKVRLKVVHDGEERTVVATRRAINVPVVASLMKTVCGKKIGIVALSSFTSGAHAEVYAALQKLKKQGAQAYIFDLRNNGGGLVDEAQLIASAFLSDGPIVTTRGRNVPTRTLDATGDPIVPKAPLVVLTNGGTASASEIVAGALQDRGRATLIGEKTFGKGVFQQVIELSNGGALDITAGQYFTPKGRNLGGKGVSQGAGLEPDLLVKQPDEAKKDLALRAALSKLGGCAKVN
jgi:carboxyl-terminal processing protease